MFERYRPGRTGPRDDRFHLTREQNRSRMTSETTPEQPPTARRLGWLRSATVVAVGMAVMNVAAYGFTLVAVRAIAPSVALSSRSAVAPTRTMRSLKNFPSS